MIKRTIFIFCLTAMVLGASQEGFSQEKITIDKIVANVGNSAILYSEVVEAAAELAKQHLQEGYTSDRDLFYEALESLMETKLAYNQALIDSLIINQGEVSSYTEQMLNARIEQVGSVKNLENIHHMTIYDIRKNISQSVEEALYRNQMQSSIYQKVKVTPGEVETFFTLFPTDSIPIIPEQYVYAHIVKYPLKMEDAKQRVRESLLDMKKQVIDGSAKFETLARLYSQDAGEGGTAARGGELQPMLKAELTEEFRTALKRIKPGQITEIVETEYGFHIIQLTDIVNDRYHMRHILMKPQYTSDELYEGSRFLDSLVTDIRAGKISFEQTAMQYSDDASTKMNGGVVNNTEYLKLRGGGNVNASATSFRFKREDFAYMRRDYMTIIDMQQGDISDSFQGNDLMGNALSKVIKLVEVIPVHSANIADDYLVLEQAALNSKMAAEYQKWMNKTIDATYIRIVPEYRVPEKFINKKWHK